MQHTGNLISAGLGNGLIKQAGQDLLLRICGKKFLSQIIERQQGMQTGIFAAKCSLRRDILSHLAPETVRFWRQSDQTAQAIVHGPAEQNLVFRRGKTGHMWIPGLELTKDCTPSSVPNRSPTRTSAISCRSHACSASGRVSHRISVCSVRIAESSANNSLFSVQTNIVPDINDSLVIFQAGTDARCPTRLQEECASFK